MAPRTTTTAWGARTGETAVTANGRYAVTVTNALGHEERRWHDAGHGAVRRLAGPNGLSTHWSHDGFGRTKQERRADGTVTYILYQSCSELVRVCARPLPRPLSVPRTQERRSRKFVNIMQLILCHGLVTAKCPAHGVQVVRTVSTGRATTVRHLDAHGRTVRTETQGFDGRAVYQDTEYDGAGRVARGSRAYFAGDTARWTRFTYDALGRVKRETRPDGGRTQYSYPGVVKGMLREGIHVYPAGTGTVARTTARYRDALGRVVEVSDPEFNATRYTYDAFGHRLTTTDSAGHVRTVTYDLRGAKRTLSDPDMGRWSYAYNAYGELISQTDAKGQTEQMSYDRLGRVVRRVEAQGTTRWTYDTALGGKGKVHRVRAPGGYVRSHGYDSLGRPQSEAMTIGLETFTLSRTYDAAGRVARLAYPKTGFAVEHVYNARGYLHQVRDAAQPATVYWTAHRLNASGQLEEHALGNGLVTRRTHDVNLGLVRSIRTGDGEDAEGVQDLEYAYDSLGNLAWRQDYREQVRELFNYDWLNRVSRARVYARDTFAQLEDKRYSYDALGNLVTKSDVGASAYVYGTGNGAGAGDAGPHAVVSAGGHAYAYDDNGNMVSGAGRTLGWTSFNKPRTVTTSTTTSTFEYGAERQRIRQVQVQGAASTTTTYVGGVFEQVAKTGEATRRVHYLFAGAERVAVYTTDDAPTPVERVRYLHTDPLGSVDTVTDESGAVVERLSYDAFGKRRVATGAGAWGDAALPVAGAETPRGFTGHEHLDALALVHMNGRVYDPELGRFLSADPFVQYPHSQGLNRYSYALNNPLSFTDPSGYWSFNPFRAVRRVVRGVAKAVKSIVRNKVVQSVATIAAGICCGAECASAASAFFTAVNGGDAGDILRAGAVTFVTAEAFTFVGDHFPNSTFAEQLGKSVAHGVVGGVGAKASGGGVPARLSRRQCHAACRAGHRQDSGTGGSSVRGGGARGHGGGARGWEVCQRGGDRGVLEVVQR